MTAELRSWVVSGTADLTGSQAFAMVLLCGLNGSVAIPLRCDADGNLYTSGLN